MPASDVILLLGAGVGEADIGTLVSTNADMVLPGVGEADAVLPRFAKPMLCRPACKPTLKIPVFPIPKLEPLEVSPTLRLPGGRPSRGISRSGAPCSRPAMFLQAGAVAGVRGPAASARYLMVRLFATPDPQRADVEQARDSEAADGSISPMCCRRRYRTWMRCRRRC